MASTRIYTSNPTLAEVAVEFTEESPLGPVTVADLAAAAKQNPHVLVKAGRLTRRDDVSTLYFTVAAIRGLI